MVFGMWVLVTGILRIEAATRINKDKKRTNYRTAMVTGVVTTLIGLFGFINPLVTLLTTVLLLGFFLVMQGINALELGINMPHEKKSYVRIYKRKREAVKITEEEETPEKVAERLKSKEEAEANAGAIIDENI
jgi:chromate transport protein ChrA